MLRSHDPECTLIMRNFNTHMVVLITINLHTKFEMYVICSKDMTGTNNVETGHVTLTTPTWETVKSSEG